jgi:hypothetical protein
MSTARAGARFVALCSLMGLALFGATGPVAARTAVADDSTQVATTTPATQEKVSPAEVHSTPAPAPATSARADSVVAEAVKDSASAAPAGDESKAKDPPPAERPEDAAATPSGKAPGAAAIPANVSKPPEPETKQQKAIPTGPDVKARPKGATRPVAGRGPKSAPKTGAIAKPMTTRQQPNGAAPPSVLPPEGRSESDRVGSELERTERFAARVQRSVLTSKNTRAVKLFASALDFQADSREAYKVRQYARAERLTLAARDFADRASRMVGPPREDPDFVEHILKRTDDALERAKDVLRNGADRASWRSHEDLRNQQKDAWKTFKDGDVGSAYKQTLAVREGVLALLRQLQDLPVPRETAEKAIVGAQAALEQANKELGPKPNGEAVRLVRLANEYLAKARQSFQRGSYRSALLQAKVVERHAEHAVDVGRPRSG